MLSNAETEYENGQLYFTGLLKNNYSDPAVNVEDQNRLSWDKEGLDKFDTRYVFVDYVAANGARTLHEPVDVNLPQNERLLVYFNY